MSELAGLEQRALAELAACGAEAALRSWHTRYFGKDGEVSAALKMGSSRVDLQACKLEYSIVSPK